MDVGDETAELVKLMQENADAAMQRRKEAKVRMKRNMIEAERFRSEQFRGTVNNNKVMDGEAELQKPPQSYRERCRLDAQRTIKNELVAMDRG
jgi:hypothetical protein